MQMMLILQCATEQSELPLMPSLVLHLRLNLLVQNQRAAAANPNVYENYQLEYGTPYQGAAGKDPQKKGSTSWLKNATKLGKSS